MPSEEVFISYSHDSVEHVTSVLALSDRLRSEGIDCVLDQYEVAPPEGWPRWMDKKIRDARYVILVCTERYYKRVMGEEAEGTGLGVRWEGNLIYQHFYNAGTINNRFLPVCFKSSHRKFIPTPLQGSTSYCLTEPKGYDDLYLRLIDQPKIKKPDLGKRRPLPRREVKTNPAMFISMPINVDLWNAAQWSATFYGIEPGRPPLLGLAFRNRGPARKIFEEWHQRYGDNDEYEELRISIVEGVYRGKGINRKRGYAVHVAADPETAMKRLEDHGFSNGDLWMGVSRFNFMAPSSTSRSLDAFKSAYRQHKTYYLAPGVYINDQQVDPIFDLAIRKGRVLFREASDVGSNDLDIVVLDPDANPTSGRSRRS